MQTLRALQSRVSWIPNFADFCGSNNKFAFAIEIARSLIQTCANWPDSQIQVNVLQTILCVIRPQAVQQTTEYILLHLQQISESASLISCLSVFSNFLRYFLKPSSSSLLDIRYKYSKCYLIWKSASLLLSTSPKLPGHWVKQYEREKRNVQHSSSCNFEMLLELQFLINHSRKWENKLDLCFIKSVNLNTKYLLVFL